MDLTALMVFAVLGAAWLAAMPAGLRTRRWHHAHVTLGLLVWGATVAFADGTPFARTLAGMGAAVGAVAVFAWCVGLWLRNHGLMDVFYPVMALTMGGAALSQAADLGASPGTLFVVLQGVWCVRLMVHVWGSNFATEQEPYATMRRIHGRRWPVWSFFSIYVLQGTMVWIWMMPAAFIMQRGADDWRLSDLLALALWLLGFFYQAVGDHQLNQFKRDPANRGKVMRSGLWRTTRHPNYFGEICMWWGLFLLALPHPHGWIALVGPIHTTWFMAFGSALPSNERHMRKTRGELWEAYVRDVPPLVPRPWGRAPKSVERVVK